MGKNRLDKAIALYNEAHPGNKDTFQTTWLPFYLDREAPKQGVDKMQFHAKKFGEQRSKMMMQRLSMIGEEAGIKFSFGGKTGNTRESHRLIQLGREKGPEVQTRVVEELFKAYFENEQDITSHEVLQAVGVKVGLDETEVKNYLASDKGGSQVDKEVMQAQSSFIGGVPYFTIQGKYHLEGAQDPEDFLEIFRKVKSTGA